MTGREPEDGGFPGDDGQSVRELWSLARDLDIGDVVKLNRDIVFEVRDVESAGGVHEFSGVVGGKWRVLQAFVNSVKEPKYVVPEEQTVTDVFRLEAVGETVLSSVLVGEFLSRDLYGGGVYDEYVDGQDADGVVFDDGVSVIGRCPCGGWVGEVDGKAVCESCGSWVSIRVWRAWGNTVENAEWVVDDDTVDVESVNKSLRDFE